jgi:hypothetical protein
MQDGTACDHPVPAAANEKIDAGAFEDQTEEIEPKPSEKAAWQNQSKSDEAIATRATDSEMFASTTWQSLDRSHSNLYSFQQSARNGIIEPILSPTFVARTDEKG